MQNNEIGDDQLSSSSHANCAKKARLNGNRGWRPDDEDYTPWIQVKFNQPTEVTGIITQGAKYGSNFAWVTEYEITYLPTDGDHWAIISSADGGMDVQVGLGFMCS